MKKWMIAAMAVSLAMAGCGKKSDSKTSSQSSSKVEVGFPVGMTAPEIEGEDIDGKTFKLSDYRGKVVLLDFWGHW